MKTLCRPLTILLAATLALMSACAVPVTLPPPAVAPTSPPPTALPPTAAPAIVPPTIVLATPRPIDPARAPASDATVVKLVDDYVASLTKQDKFGGAVLIARDGKVVLNQGYGYADKVKSTPIETDTQFLIGTTQFNPMWAVLALQFRQEGRLSLDESLCAYVTPCDNRFKPITLRVLLSNMGGLPDQRFGSELGLGFNGLDKSRFFGKLAEAPSERFARPGEAFQMVTLPSGARIQADDGNSQALYYALNKVAGMETYVLAQTRIFGALNIKS